MGTRDVVVVVQKDDHSLGYFDFATGEELRRVPLPNYPHEFAISSDGRFAYSCHFGLKLAEDQGPGGDEVSVVDLAAAKWVRSISCRGWRRPHGIAFDANGRLYVLSEGSSRLLVIPDPATGNIARALPTHGSGSHIVAVTRDGAVAFCSNMFSGSVSVLSPQEEDAPVRVLSAGERPEGSAFDVTEQRLLVCNRESADIAVIDVTRQEISARIRTPPGPVRIARRTDAEFVAACYHDRSMIVVDADRGEVARRVALPGQPVSVGFDRCSGFALAGLVPSGLCVVDLDAGRIVRTIVTRAGPDPMVVLQLPL